METTVLNIWSVAGLIVDLIIVGALVFSIIHGAKKGFVYCVVWLASIVAAVIGARLATALFEEPITEFIYSKSENKIQEASEKAVLELDNINWDLMDFTPGRPEALTDEEYAVLMQNDGLAKVDEVLSSVGISENTHREKFYSLAKSIHDNSGKASEHIGKMATELAHKAIRFIVRVLLIIIVFVVVLILLRLAGTGLSKLFEKIPVVGTLDKVLGVAVNFLVFAAMILVALYAWQHLWPDSFANFAKGAPVAGFIAQNNPLIGFFGE